MTLAPLDRHNQTLLANAFPSDWQNPTPSGRYNLVVIGGGTAGLVSASIAAGLGGRVALVERHLLGGDCLNYGCVPSKALLYAARVAADASRQAELGCAPAEPCHVDFAAVMERMRRLRARISAHDSAARFRDLGVDVYLGSAIFVAPDAIEVDGRRLTFHRAVIATGSKPAVPSVDGLSDVGYLTNETIFSLERLPRRMIVIGGGPIGCELAQAFRRFGSDVHLVHRHESLLVKEDREAAEVIERRFREEGIVLHLGWSTVRAESARGSKALVIARRGEKKKIIADAILVATGRRPGVTGLGLEAAQVAFGDAGVEVDDRLRTTNPRIFAAGDVCSRHQFTHVADALARIAVQNALFFSRKKASALVIPRCTYTDPEVAHVGLTPQEAARQGIEIDSYRAEMSSVDRAVIDGEEEGFAVVHTARGSGKVVGGTIVARHAGELIGELSLLMTARLPLGRLSGTIHCYPTQVEVLKRIGDQYQRGRLTPLLARLFEKWLRWLRS